MSNKTLINRIVPNIYSNHVEGCKYFYTVFLEMDLIMDMGWIVTVASKSNPTAQITVLKYEGKEQLNNDTTFLSIEVSDVDKFYNKAKELNCEIVYPITDEPWGVRRFFIKDPNGATINILAH